MALVGTLNAVDFVVVACQAWVAVVTFRALAFEDTLAVRVDSLHRKEHRLEEDSRHRMVADLDFVEDNQNQMVELLGRGFLADIEIYRYVYLSY